MKYDSLLKEAKAIYGDTQDDACLAMYSEGKMMSHYVKGDKGKVLDMLGTWMEESEDFATLLLDVTSAYVKRRMVASVKSKDAMHQAYEDTKPKS